MRDHHAALGDHAKALEYSTKAMERCPASERIKEIHELDRKSVE